MSRGVPLRPSRILLAVGALALLHAAPTGAAMDMSGAARTAPVRIPGTYFTPPRLSIVSGDTVSWSDQSATHTVSSDGWSSGLLNYGDTFSHRFGMSGTFTYYCKIHPFMTGEVDVYDVLLDQASAPTTPGRAYPLSGRTSLPAGTHVSIEADSGSGFAAVASSTVAADGTFAAQVSPRTTTTYRAVAGSKTSPNMRVIVIDRSVTLTDVRRNGVDHLTATVHPASPRGYVSLQLKLRNRFGWWPTATTRLNSASQARFTVRPSDSVPARAALTLADGYTVLALSRPVRIGPRPLKQRAGPRRG